MKRINWIDFVKGVAILGVIADHAMVAFMGFYNQMIWQHLLFSVSAFVVLLGVTNGLSYKNRKLTSVQTVFTFWIKRLGAVLIPYTVASALYYLILPHGVRTFESFFYMLVNFRVMPLFYFVHLLVQLYFIFPVLLFLAKKGSLFIQVLFILILAFVTLVWMPLTMQPWTILLGQDFFARAFLLLFYLGILLGVRGVPQFWLYSVGIFVAFFSMERFALQTHFATIGAIPTLTSVIWVTTGILVLKMFFDRIPRNPVIGFIQYLGKHSLYIYLFHQLVIIFVFDYLVSPGIIKSMSLIHFLFIFFLAILFSLMMQIFLNGISAVFWRPGKIVLQQLRTNKK